jgi:hypothetical protein
MAAVSLAAGARAADEAPPEAKATDAALYRALKDVINRGVDLYNADNPAACYRLYEGSLLTMRPLLEHRPGLQKEIDKGLAGARRDPVMWRRAFTLRGVLDKARAQLNPNRDKLHKPKSEEAKKDEKKEDKKEEGKDEEKKGEQKKGEQKKDEQKAKKGDEKDKKEEKKDDKKDG